MTAVEMITWARSAKPGERKVYFTGFIARCRGMMPLAAATYALHADGLLTLVQRRLGPEVFEYVAIRRDLGNPSAKSELRS